MSYHNHVGPTSSRVNPPLGTLPQMPVTPPSQPDGPDVQLPPPEVPNGTPDPGTPARPGSGVPMTDGTPAACRQKNAAAFLAGETDVSVMAHYAPGLFSTEQKLDSRQPAPDDPEGVRDLVRLREDQPYG